MDNVTLIGNLIVIYILGSIVFNKPKWIFVKKADVEELNFKYSKLFKVLLILSIITFIIKFIAWYGF